MIFVTVGVQLAFDRLIRAMDEWASDHPDTEVVAQTGTTLLHCRHMRTFARVAGPDFQRLTQRAELIVAHAGMGSILTALEIGKPIIVLPRSAKLGEHRNEHQSATSQHMLAANLVRVAKDTDDLKAMIDQRGSIEPRTISAHAQPALIETLRHFIQRGDQQPRNRSGKAPSGQRDGRGDITKADSRSVGNNDAP